jgi:phosphatidylserine/phosphatidylglycerophosphate/cardiolipin synthase-like enzyme
MRFKSRRVDGYQVFAVTGVNTVSFGIDFSGAKTKGLLGFAVERRDPTEGQRFFMSGFKVFPSVVRDPGRASGVSTFEHPIQSFVWDDFTAKDGRPYEYLFYPLKGSPKNLERSSKPIRITVRTERLFSELEHDVFFNRGVASSQAYVRRFGNKKPSELEGERRQEALDWLSRQLDDAILEFIARARRGDTLLGCFYEFRYEPVVRALGDARKRGVNVRLILDGKVNATPASQSFPRSDNQKFVATLKLPKKSVIWREAKPNDIAHNKFMVLLKGKRKLPDAVWTGSTNLSDGGIHGQTNVGHWVRNETVAAQFQAYWDLLSGDPGPHAGDSDARKQNAELRSAVASLTSAPTTFDEIQKGITPIFSPRPGGAALKLYGTLVDGAARLSCITLAFGINDVFKELLRDNDSRSHLAFFLLEKEDRPNPRSKKQFVGLKATQNVYSAWGSFLRDPLYQWARETNAKALQLNQHVSYVHSKFLLRDPLGKDPIVVTGSANFSKASTNDNDENMLIIRGNQRVADIYFTEFNRLFGHYYFRSVQEKTRTLDPNKKKKLDEETLFLAETDAWVAKYKQGLKRKRLNLLVEMQGFERA